MKLLADLHTHSKNSRFGHGKNNIEEMAIEANEIGLVEIAITDHGYSHFFKTTKAKLKQARKTIDEINSWSKTKVLLGVEADIINEKGDIDIDNETLSMLDVLIVGYHKMIFTDFAGFFGNTKKTEEAKRKCTNAFVNAIKRYPVTIVSHLDSVLTTDLYEIGKVCRERGTMVEINNRHTKWNDKQMADLIDSGCMFVVSSDAHKREMVGEVDKAFEYIRKYNIPSERVVNVEFEEDEKSEQDRTFSAYRSVYEQVAKQRKAKQEALETKLKTEITGNLSDEMENALRNIAREKGLHYEQQKKATVSDTFMKESFNDGDMDDLIAKAEEYIRNEEIKNIQHENENLGNIQPEEEEELYSFDDEHPLVKDVFADKFQAINHVIKKEKNMSNETEIDENQEDLTSKNIQSDIPAYKQLETNYNSQNVKNLKELLTDESKDKFGNISSNGVKPATSSNFKKVEPENFMDSITRTKLVDNASTKNKEEKQQTPIVKRTAPKGTKRGAFIVVDNLLDESKK